MAKVILGPELRCAQRQRLEDVVPLSTPFLLFLEPTNRCNFTCRFCPTGDPSLLRSVGRKPTHMPMELFEKVVHDLEAFPDRIKSLNLYKDGEPLLHPRFVDMLRTVKKAGIADSIRVKSNGSLLNPDLNRQLVDAGLDWIGISVEGVSAERYRELSSYRMDYESFRKNLQDLYEQRGQCHIHIKIINIGLAEADREKFYGDFLPISDTCAVENPHGWTFSEERDFSLGTPQESMDGVPLVEKKVCPQALFALAINSCGTVSICCVDWAHHTVVGDVGRNTLQEIWQGDALREFRKMHLEHRRADNPACRDCTYLRTMPDNVDGFEAQILSRLAGQTHSGPKG